MYARYALVALSGILLVNGQGAPPPPGTLTTAMSGVLPVLPTPFSGVETEEGAIVYDGPSVEGFTGPGGNASVQSGLPMAMYQAILPSTNFDDLTGSTITGMIMASTASTGTGVTFSINVTGFPSEAMYGPFVYHIHNFAVPADGNCSATMGHLDPTDRGEYYPCEMAAPQTCQAGDLAGKHGNITTSSFMTSYTELYLSTDPSSPYFFGDKSIVIHSSNTTRLTCANFALVSSSNSSMSSSTMSSSGMMVTSTSGSSGGSGSSSATMTTSGSPSMTSASVSVSTYTGAAVPVSMSGAAGMLSGLSALILGLLL